MELEEAKNERPVFKSNLHEIKKSEGLNRKKKKVQHKIVKCFTMHKTRLPSHSTPKQMLQKRCKIYKFRK